jgi:addiction module RelB/DinJ family antitoxin
MDTSLLIKTKKSLKLEAQKVAEEMGIPLTTVINSFLKQFVREKEITLSANTYTPTPYLAKLIKDAFLEFKSEKGKSKFSSADEMIKSLEE